MTAHKPRRVRSAAPPPGPSDPAPVPPGQALPPTGGDDLRAELENAQAEAERYKDLYLRARADLENQQKRMNREIDTRAGLAKGDLVRSLLPVKDGLEAGLVGAASDNVAASLRQGMEIAVRGWDAAFAAAGIEAIDAMGQAFDPELHEAVAVRPPGVGEPPNTVVQVSQKGYVLDGRLIRPARVVVTGRGSA
jgi:molecular chaperone GrpE